MYRFIICLKRYKYICQIILNTLLKEILQIQFERPICTSLIAFSSLPLTDNHYLKFCDYHFWCFLIKTSLVMYLILSNMSYNFYNNGILLWVISTTVFFSFDVTFLRVFHIGKRVSDKFFIFIIVAIRKIHWTHVPLFIIFLLMEECCCVHSLYVFPCI